MVVVQLRHLKQVLVSEQQAISLKAELPHKMALKYSILLVNLISLVKAIKHYTLCGLLVVHQRLQILVLKSPQLLNVLEQAISY